MYSLRLASLLGVYLYDRFMLIIVYILNKTSGVVHVATKNIWSVVSIFLTSPEMALFSLGPYNNCSGSCITPAYPPQGRYPIFFKYHISTCSAVLFHL